MEVRVSLTEEDVIQVIKQHLVTKGILPVELATLAPHVTFHYGSGKDFGHVSWEVE